MKKRRINEHTEKIEAFFYSKASKRIGDRIANSGLTYAQIHISDHKQICRIVKNTRTNNNPFLICDSAMKKYYLDEETGDFKCCGLLGTPELNFSSEKEILWGTDEEISSYIFDLFILLWEEVSSSPKFEITPDLYLCDYVPYAKYSSYWEVLFSPTNIYPALYYSIYEDEVINGIDPARNEAIKHLYNKCKKEFLSLFISFTNIQTSFHKLDKIIENELLANLFVKMIKKYEPDSSSLGLRVRDLIKYDLSRCAEQVVSAEKDPYYFALLNASSKYAFLLEEIQEQQIKRNGAE